MASFTWRPGWDELARNMNKPGHDNPRGFTLIEVLLAMALVSFILFGTAELLVRAQQLSRDADARIWMTDILAATFEGLKSRPFDGPDLEPGDIRTSLEPGGAKNHRPRTTSRSHVSGHEKDRTCRLRGRCPATGNPGRPLCLEIPWILNMGISRDNARPKQARKRGFSLIESLLALVLSLVIILAGIELFGAVRHVFFKLERYQSDRESVSAALEKIKADLQRAGQGFPQEIHPGDPGIDATDNALTVRWLEDTGNGPEVRVVLYYFDTEKSTLRRKAGAGTAQPLLEGVGAFSCIFDRSTQMTEVEIRLALDLEKSYGLKFLSKNMVFAAGRT